MGTKPVRTSTDDTPGPNGPDDRHAEAHRHAELLLVEASRCARATRREDLRRQAVMLTLDLADTVARRYRGRGIDHDDLVQVGRLALVKAAAGFRQGRGSSFVAYAVPTISGEIKRHFRDCGWTVRPPRRLQELRARLSGEEELLRHRLRREPTPRELAAALGLDRTDVLEVRAGAASYRAVSLDAPDGSSSDGSASADLLPRVDDHAEAIVRRDAVARAVACLSERERTIIRMRFVEERTQADIGRALGVSQMQVSRLLSGILARLRRELADPLVA